MSSPREYLIDSMRYGNTNKWKNIEPIEIYPEKEVLSNTVNTLEIPKAKQTPPTCSLIGKWVRFYKDGQFIIGEVRYTRKTILGKLEYCTDVGSVDEDSVLEVR